MQTPYVVRVFFGICLGAVVGVLVSPFAIPNIDSLSKQPTTWSVYDKRSVQDRGILREYDAASKTVASDIESPYAADATISLQARIDGATLILYTPEQFDSTEGAITWYEKKSVGERALENGRQALLVLLPSAQGLYAAVVHLLT